MTSQQHHSQWIPEWTFGDRLRKVRRERGLSQAQAAADLGVKTPQIASWETGANHPRDVVAVAKRCQIAWGVPAEWMLGLDVDTAPPPPDDAPRQDDREAAVARLAASKRRVRPDLDATARYLLEPAAA